MQPKRWPAAIRAMCSQISPRRPSPYHGRFISFSVSGESVLFLPFVLNMKYTTCVWVNIRNLRLLSKFWQTSIKVQKISQIRLPNLERTLSGGQRWPASSRYYPEIVTGEIVAKNSTTTVAVRRCQC